jgi:hypothetical protein
MGEKDTIDISSENNSAYLTYLGSDFLLENSIVSSIEDIT